MRERTKQDECWNCMHREDIPGDCHIRCRKPDSGITGNTHGVVNGWFFYPINFDPIWKLNFCVNYTPSDGGAE